MVSRSEDLKMRAIEEVSINSPANGGAATESAPIIPLFWVLLGGVSLGALLLIALSAPHSAFAMIRTPVSSK
jgi:hypothetical protein